MKPLLSALFLGSVILAGCNAPSPSSSQTAEEQPRLLPKTSEIRTVKLIGIHENKTYDVPPDQLPPILALLNSGSKDDHPKKWEILGYNLEITTKTGEDINVWLFRTYERKGAFSIKRTEGERQYYRASTDDEITATIEKARRASK